MTAKREQYLLFFRGLWSAISTGPLPASLFFVVAYFYPRESFGGLSALVFFLFMIIHPLVLLVWSVVKFRKAETEKASALMLMFVAEIIFALSVLASIDFALH